MPELPEVETMVRGVRPFIQDRLITSVQRCRTKCRPISIKPAFTRFAERIQRQTVAGVRRLGKRIVLDLSNGSSVVIEPRMTGLVLLANPPTVEHLRLEWQFEGHRDYDSIFFWDRRGLGTVRLYSPAELARDLGPNSLGPDALDMSEALWRERLSATGREIKVALLDQKLVAGIGNLYASEILHLARINPLRRADSLSKRQIERLAVASHAVLERAIEHEGSTLGDGTYRNALSQSGTYQNEHRVYMREAEPCPTCGRGSIVRLVQAQRSTFYCPRCQH